MLHSLPPELLWDVLMKLDITSLQYMCRTDTYLEAWCSVGNDKFWKARYKRDFYPLGYTGDWKEKWLEGPGNVDPDQLFLKAIETCDEDILRSMSIYKLYPRQFEHTFYNKLMKCPHSFVSYILEFVTGIYTRFSKRQFFERVIDNERYDLLDFIETDDEIKDIMVHTFIMDKINNIEYILKNIPMSKETLIHSLGRVMPPHLSTLIPLYKEAGLTDKEIFSILIDKALFRGDIEFLKELLSLAPDTLNSREMITFGPILNVIQVNRVLPLLKYLAELGIHPTKEEVYLLLNPAADSTYRREGREGRKISDYLRDKYLTDENLYF